MHDFTPAEAYRYEQDVRWETTRASVEAFRMAHGRWPQASTNDGDERYLGHWLGKSRRDARAGRLSTSRQQALDEMGARVGADWHTGQPLTNAAHGAKTGTAGTGAGAGLVASLLDGTGWEGASFSARLRIAEGFFTYHGHWPDPADQMPASVLADTMGVDPQDAAQLTAATLELGHWVVVLRRAYTRLSRDDHMRRGVVLSPEQRQAVAAMLERVGDDWTPPTLAQAWERERAKVEEFYQQHGDWPSVTGATSEERRKGRWLARQQLDDQQQDLSDERRHALNAMGVRLRAAWRVAPTNTPKPSRNSSRKPSREQ